MMRPWLNVLVLGVFLSAGTRADPPADKEHREKVTARAFSRDGRFLVCGHDDGSIVLRDASDGRITSRWSGGRSPVLCLALTSAGNVMATGSEDGTIRVCAVPSGLEILAIPCGKGPVRAVEFRGWRTLSASFRDPPAMQWDLGTLARERLQAAMEGPLEAEKLWDALVSPHPYWGYRAVWALASDPDCAIPLIRKHLVGEGFAPRVRRLILDLDDDRFKVREAASEELWQLLQGEYGASAISLLQSASAKSDSLEVKARLDNLLADAQGIDLDASDCAAMIRIGKAVGILALIDTDASRRTLDEMAGNAVHPYAAERAREVLNGR